jgi:hypothetical protein
MTPDKIQAWRGLLEAGERAIFSRFDSDKAVALAEAIGGSLVGLHFTLGSGSTMEPDFYAAIEVVPEARPENELLRRQLEGEK